MLLPIGALAWILSSDERIPGAPTATQILWGQPQKISAAEEFPARLELSLGRKRTLVAPGWTGLVTEVASGLNTVTDGAPILSINGIERSVCVSGSPLFRPLTKGDVGQDVLILRHCLGVLLGRRIPVDVREDKVDASVEAAIRSVAKRIGSPQTEAFDPAWVVWSATSNWRLLRVSAAVGSPAPAAGTILAEGEPPVSSANVAIINDDGSILDQGSASKSTLVFRAGGLSFRLSSRGHPDLVSIRSRLADLLRLASSSAPEAAGGDPPGADTSGNSAPIVTGTVVLSGPPRLQLPVSAVVTGTSGASCVYVRDSAGKIVAEAVSVRASQLGQVVVAGLSQSNSVVLNPPAIASRPSCTS